jgi:hypothetical protein
VGAIGAGETCGVFVKRARFVSEYLSDHLYEWSDSKVFQFIFQPFCFDPASCSDRVANSKSDIAFSRVSPDEPSWMLSGKAVRTKEEMKA